MQRYPRSQAVLVSGFLGFALATCGSDDGGKTMLEVLVFADWNANGQMDPAEERGVLKVEVEVAGGSKLETGAGGLASFEVAAGTHRVHLGKIPPSFRLTTPSEFFVSVAAGYTAEVSFGIRPDTPPSRLPFKYVLMGDSITSGYTQNADTTFSVDGFDRPLQVRLQDHFGRASIANRAIAGSKSSCGVSMLQSRLLGTPLALLTCDCRRSDQSVGQPEDTTSMDTEPFGPGAYLVITYGTNDINDRGNCLEGCVRGECSTIQHLKAIVERTRAAGAIPVLGTLPPGYKAHSCAPAWNQNFNAAVGALNADIRAFASSSGTLVADNWKAFRSDKSPPIDQLISDTQIFLNPAGQRRCGTGLHPTRAGYALMAEVASLAITGLPSPYDATPVPSFKPLAEALADYDRFVQESGFVAEPLPHVP